MTNTTLERAARALWFERGGSWCDASDRQKQQCIYETRAVLMAVREPDEAMVKAATDLEEEIIGTYGCVEPTGGFEPNGPKLCFTAMIDAILAND